MQLQIFRGPVLPPKLRNFMKLKRYTLLLYFIGMNLLGQDIQLPIWPEDNIPFRIPSDEEEQHETNGILRISKVQVPALDIYLADSLKNTGKAVLIFPGGGYRILAYHWEGSEFAAWLAKEGITGIVLKYRLPDSKSLDTPALAPLADAQRAIRICRENATSWNFSPDAIGVMGFSAGGHLAASLSTQFEPRVYSEVDDTDAVNARPDFAALIYPVIDFNGPAMHSGSRNALLGPYPSDFLIDFFSPRKQVTENTPPTFLVHANDDRAVPVQNSLGYYESLTSQGVSASLHLFPSGGHGFAMAKDNALLSRWKDILLAWILDL